MSIPAGLPFLIMLVPIVYLILRLLRPAVWRAAIQVDSAVQRQRLRGGGRAEVAAAKEQLRRELSEVPLPRRVVEWAVGPEGWTD